MNSRKSQAQQALNMIGLNRFVQFIRAIRNDSGCLAVRLFNEHLDAGLDVESIILDGDEFGFLLSAKLIDADNFLIAFGCLPGSDVGDGGEWKVQFAADGSLLIAPDVLLWMV